MPNRNGAGGCACCGPNCSNLPDQLYISSSAYHPTKVPFTYDPTSGKWLGAMFVTAVTSSGRLPAAAIRTNACSGSGTGTWIVLQMTAAKLVGRQVEGCFFPGGTPDTVPQNTLPSDISGPNIFGVRVGSGRGTYTTGGTATCAESPLTLTAIIPPFTFIGIITDTITITDTP